MIRQDIKPQANVALHFLRAAKHVINTSANLSCVFVWVHVFGHVVGMAFIFYVKRMRIYATCTRYYVRVETQEKSVQDHVPGDSIELRETKDMVDELYADCTPGTSRSRSEEDVIDTLTKHETDV